MTVLHNNATVYADVRTDIWVVRMTVHSNSVRVLAELAGAIERVRFYDERGQKTRPEHENDIAKYVDTILSSVIYIDCGLPCYYTSGSGNLRGKHGI